MSPVCVWSINTSSWEGVWVLLHVDSKRRVCSGVKARDIPGGPDLDGIFSNLKCIIMQLSVIRPSSNKNYTDIHYSKHVVILTTEYCLRFTISINPPGVLFIADDKLVISKLPIALKWRVTDQWPSGSYHNNMIRRRYTDIILVYASDQGHYVTYLRLNVISVNIRAIEWKPCWVHTLFRTIWGFHGSKK